MGANLIHKNVENPLCDGWLAYCHLNLRKNRSSPMYEHWKVHGVHWLSQFSTCKGLSGWMEAPKTDNHELKIPKIPSSNFASVKIRKNCLNFEKNDHSQSPDIQCDAILLSNRKWRSATENCRVGHHGNTRLLLYVFVRFALMGFCTFLNVVPGKGLIQILRGPDKMRCYSLCGWNAIF